MEILRFLKTHKMSVLSSLLVVAAALLGADLDFAMAVDPVTLAEDPNPSKNMNPVSGSNPDGRPAGEELQKDEQGGRTQLQGKAATAGDVRDAGLEAEDYDPDVDAFRPFAFPIETYIARQCRPVKVNSPEHGHYRTGSADLEAVWGGDAVTITAGQDTAGASGSTKTYTASNGVLALPVADFDNAESMLTCSQVLVSDVPGYTVNATGEEIPDGELVLYVLSHEEGDDYIKFKVLNPPTVGGSITIPTNANFLVMSTAGSESQMNVDSETFIPEKETVYLQKKIESVVITDALQEQIKKVPHTKERILANAEYNFKRKCARSHWNSTKKRIDVYVKQIKGREPVYFEQGILRQLNMLYTLSGTNEMTDDDLLAISTLMFTDNSQTDSATAFCGKKAMQRLIRLVNSADKYKDVSKVQVSEYGVKVRKYIDNFGALDFIYDPTLNDIGYSEAMVIVDLKHASRPYIYNDKSTQRDMKKTGEAREAMEYNLVKYDCVALNGFNSMLVLPANKALSIANLGGIQAEFESVSALPSGDGLTASAKQKKYYLTADDTASGFKNGDVIEWDTDLNGWVKFQGLVRASA